MADIIINALKMPSELLGADIWCLILILITLVLFAADKWPMGFVAMVSSIVLALTGTMEVKQIYAGWSSNLVLMLIGMMIVFILFTYLFAMTESWHTPEYKAAYEAYNTAAYNAFIVAGGGQVP